MDACLSTLCSWGIPPSYEIAASNRPHVHVCTVKETLFVLFRDNAGLVSSGKRLPELSHSATLLIDVVLVIDLEVEVPIRRFNQFQGYVLPGSNLTELRRSRVVKMSSIPIDRKR